LKKANQDRVPNNKTKRTQSNQVADFPAGNALSNGHTGGGGSWLSTVAGSWVAVGGVEEEMERGREILGENLLEKKENGRSF